MLKRNRQPELVDKFVDDLLQNPRISPPTDLDLDVAEATRDLVLTEQKNASSFANQQAQKRIWENTLYRAAQKSTHQRTSSYWKFSLSSGLLMLLISVSALIVIVVLLEQNKPLTSVSNLDTQSITISSIPTATLKTYEVVAKTVTSPDPPDSEITTPFKNRVLHINLLLKKEFVYSEDKSEILTSNIQFSNKVMHNQKNTN